MITFKVIFIRFLLMPLVVLVLAVVMRFILKARKLSTNKLLIVYVLLAGILLGIPGVGGLAGNTFSPYWFLFTQIVYLLLGCLHWYCLSYYFPNSANDLMNADESTDDKRNLRLSILFQVFTTLICMVLGAYLFTVVFNLFSQYEGYAFSASTSILTFPLPLIFYYTYLRFTNIPLDIYKVWTFSSGKDIDDFEGMDFDKLLVLNLEFTRSPEDGQRFKVKAKAPEFIKLGDWFHRFIEDYNTKFPQSIIVTEDEYGHPHSWIFYTKRSFIHSRKYLDFELSVTKNRITERTTIICKRVLQHKEEIVTQTFDEMMLR